MLLSLPARGISFVVYPSCAVLLLFLLSFLLFFSFVVMYPSISPAHSPPSHPEQAY